MVKRTLIAVGLGLALSGGMAATAGASSHGATRHEAAQARHGVAARYATRQADAGSGETGSETADADANVACGTDPVTGDQVGDCQVSQNTSDPGNDSNSSSADQGGTDSQNGGAGQSGQ